MSVNSWNSGEMSATPGNIDAARIAPAMSDFPLNSSRASAYAALVPTSSAMIVTTPPMSRLFSSARPRWLPSAVENAVV